MSDGDVDMDGDGEPEVGVEEKEAMQEEDYDEIEYMPPTAISEWSSALSMRALSVARRACSPAIRTTV